MRVGLVICMLVVIASVCRDLNVDSILRSTTGIFLGLTRSTIYIGLFFCLGFFCSTTHCIQKCPQAADGGGWITRPVDADQDGKILFCCRSQCQPYAVVSLLHPHALLCRFLPFLFPRLLGNLSRPALRAGRSTGAVYRHTGGHGADK